MMALMTHCPIVLLLMVMNMIKLALIGVFDVEHDVHDDVGRGDDGYDIIHMTLAMMT